jgi:hypothetical protein
MSWLKDAEDFCTAQRGPLHHRSTQMNARADGQV